MIKVGLVSLGCAKNLIDSEIMVGHLQQAGMTMTPEADLADVLIINTCSFIDMAKKESVGAIHEAVDARGESKKRKKQKIIVAGCLSQRFRDELPTLMPDVDAFIGLDQITQVAPIIQGLFGKDHAQENLVTKGPQYIPDYDTPRFRLIPKIRGRHRSRTQESVVREVRDLVKSGVKEINLISQDTTYFGMDKWEGERPKPTSGVDSTKGESLSTLLRELNKIPGDFWIRLLYTHPAHWSDDLIAAIAESPKVARYIDIPLQHISDNMLTLMRRETNGSYIRNLLKRIRAGIPGIAIRTTFIVGFPGETEADFNELLQFIEDEKFERAGVFNYSREEGTRADKMDEHVHHMTRKARWNEAMRAIERNVQHVNQRHVGKMMRVLVEEPGIARSAMDAPDIDTTVFVDKKLPVGDFAEVKIKDWRGYDLVAG
jgi:ribosomal protein S12 methylthiotransferase